MLNHRQRGLQDNTCVAWKRLSDMNIWYGKTAVLTQLPSNLNLN